MLWGWLCGPVSLMSGLAVGGRSVLYFIFKREETASLKNMIGGLGPTYHIVVFMV